METDDCYENTGRKTDDESDDDVEEWLDKELSESRFRSSHEGIRQEKLESWISHNKESFLWIVKSSQYYRLLEDITTSATEYAEKMDIDSSEFIHDILNRARDVVTEIQHAVTDHSFFDKDLSDEDWQKFCNFWGHQEFPISRIESRKIPTIYKEQVEKSVGTYLELPFRSKAIDRLLVDILVAMEIYAYGNAALNKDRFAAIKGQFENALIFAGGAGFSIFAGSKEWIDREWSHGIAYFLLAVFIIYFIRTIFLLPSLWKDIFKIKKCKIKLLGIMVSMYKDLESSGPISANHIRTIAESSGEKGVVWPAPLFALLDDISQRTGRF